MAALGSRLPRLPAGPGPLAGLATHPGWLGLPPRPGVPRQRGRISTGELIGCRGRGADGTCAAAQAALSRATAGHRQLVLQLGGSADCAQLREELRRSSAWARELSAGLRSALVAGLRRPPAGPQERLELERLWVLFLCALELFLQDLRKAHHLGQLFGPPGAGGAALLRTGLGGRPEGPCRGGGRPGRQGSHSPERPPAAPRPEEEIEQMRAMLAEMESRANIPLWTVEATQRGRAAGSAATRAGAARGQRQAAGPRPGTGHCCAVL
ncbi:regulator of G-protein signaling 9-binding protein-like [Struthio camelus]|uniref:regulator of G-protein signaling 9-binding protein-like n=1 Tax=Struthio camelus TaxID=8801 RepID=UPI003603DDE1